jgi:predicted nucleotidyltransferase
MVDEGALWTGDGDKTRGVVGRMGLKLRSSQLKMDIPEREIVDFCQRWQIVELAVFGSVLREDFGPDSDVDVLVMFGPDANWSLLDHLRMEEELASLLNREIDLLSKRAVEQSQNWLRRREILDTAEVIYGAG